jgi:hypothetical protein
MKNARIVKIKIGARLYYQSEIEKPYLFLFKTWEQLGYVSVESAHVIWCKSLGSYADALAKLHKYEDLYGEKLNILKD